MVLGTTTELLSTMQHVKPTVAGGGKETSSLWILRWEMGLCVCLGVSQLSCVVCEMLGQPSPGVVCSLEEKPELQISSECAWLLLQDQSGRVGQSPFPASFGFLSWVEGEWASLTFSLLG